MKIISKLASQIAKPFIKAYKLHIKKDEFLISIKKWRSIKGDQTLRLEYPLDSKSIVFDLGGYKGDFAAAMHERYGCSVYVFEPVKIYYEECKNRFSGNEKIHCFNYGLSDSDSIVEMGDDGDASSLIRASEESKTEQVEVKAFVSEMARLSVKEIDLMKMNIEGAEFIIFPHLFQFSMISKIKHIQVQFHEFYPDARKLRDQIRQRLNSTHVETWNFPFVWESWSRKDLQS